MKKRYFNMPNKRVVATTEPGATTDSFYTGPAPVSEEVEVGVSIAEVAPTLYCTLTDGGYYNSVSIIINMLNDTTPVQRTLIWDMWSHIGGLHSKAVTSVNFDQVVDFTATYDGLCVYEGESCAPSSLKIQAKDAGGEFIEIEASPVTTYSYYPCFFQEATNKSDLIDFGIAGVAIDNLYYCRVYDEMKTLDWFQVQGYTKVVDAVTVNQDFQVYSLVRKIRVPGNSKAIAYDFFAKAGTKP